MLMGTVVKPQGIKGEIRLKTTDDWRLIDIKPCSVILKDPLDRETRHEIIRARQHGGVWIIQLRDVLDRNQAEALRGFQCLISPDDLPETPEGVYFDHELVGLKVETTSGEAVGTLREVLHGPAQDIYVIRDGEKEVLVPAVDTFINKIDVGHGIMIIDPIEGLL